MNQFVIGLLGPAGVGKDSVCAALGWPKAEMVRWFKDALQPLFDKVGIDINTRDDKERVRPFLVAGAKCFRAIDENVSVRNRTVPDGQRAAFVDVRYLNEVLAISAMGGVIYYLWRDGIEPANDEERRSFAEIAAWEKSTGIRLHRIHNSTPAEAAKMIGDDIARRAQMMLRAVQ